MENFNEMKNSIAQHLMNVDYSEKLSNESDLSDIGNEVGIAISKYLKVRKTGYTIEDFIRGIKHGVSLVN